MNKYGWRPQLPDHRDSMIAPIRIKDPQQLPAIVDLRSGMPPVYDQGNLGSCTANVIAGAVEYQLIKQKYKWIFTPSRLFIYYNERVIENSVDSDAGADLRDGMKSINSVGVCPENQLKDKWNWPYDTTTYTTQPPSECYLDAKLHQSLKYDAVPQTQDGLCSILSGGMPVTAGISVYDSFEGDDVISTGQVPLPLVDESFLGGHAILLVGYNIPNNVFIFRNSWGVSYGQAGYGTIPFDYILNPDLSSDFWAIEVMV